MLRIALVGLRALAWFLLLWAVCVGAQAADAQGAPVPASIFTAKKIFISNAGADSGLFPHPFSGGEERAYNQFYAAIEGWGRYEIVGDPAEAELVFELQLNAPNGPANANKAKGASDPLPMFRLVIFDGKTHYVLWALTESIDEALVQKTHDRNFDDALSALVLDLKSLHGKAATPVAAR
jgi:hypothetical protein